MATLNYTRRLDNLRNRRYDQDLHESVISKSFSASDIPDNIKYMMECMQPIDKKYNDKTIEAASRVQGHLEGGFNLHFNRAYRTQGSVKTSTNIKVYSDFDLLTIIDRYFYPEVSGGNEYTASDPDQDIKELRVQATKILKNIYDEVDDSHEKCVSIYNKSLHRKVDVVFGFWFNSKKYEETKDRTEYYRGIYLYKFPNGPKSKDFPFAHISQVNSKGDNTNDGSRKAIRLLKTLRADSDNELKLLKSFQLTTLVHRMDNTTLDYSHGKEFAIAKAVSEEMDKLISDAPYRKSIYSPNGLETPFDKDEIVPDIKSLKADLDLLIEDTAKEILSTQSAKRAIINYQ